jgi:hypothetical protein
MDDERQAPGAVDAKEALEATVVVRMTVRDDYRAQLLHRHVEYREVPSQRGRRQPGVIEDRGTSPSGPHGDERGEAVLRHELIAIGEVLDEVPVDPLGAGHQHVDVVVDDDSDVDPVDRVEHASAHPSNRHQHVVIAVVSEECQGLIQR